MKKVIITLDKNYKEIGRLEIEIKSDKENKHLISDMCQIMNRES